MGWTNLAWSHNDWQSCAVPYRQEWKLGRKLEPTMMQGVMKEEVGCDVNVVDYSEWMTNIAGELHRVPLHNLAIPGKQAKVYFYYIDKRIRH